MKSDNLGSTSTLKVPEGYALWYHGSATYFDQIDLSCSGILKDFGPGFYLSDDFDQACARARSMQARVGDSHAWVYTYLVPKTFPKHFNVRVFKGAPSIPWVEFIMDCWTVPPVRHSYDVVLGATADAHPRKEIDRYRAGLFGVVGTDAAKRSLIAALKTYRLGRQLCLTTKRAVNLISRIAVQEV